MQNRQQRKQRLEQQAKSMQTEKSLKDSSDSESTMPSTAEDEDGHLNVEEILWSQQNYRIKSHQSNTMRLLDMLEKDVQLKAQKRPRPFLENSGGGISRRRNAKPEQIELMDWYDRDCLLIHRNWAELSADANARRGASRVNLAAKLPRHTFECDDIAMVAANDDVEAQETATTRTRAHSISSSNGGCATNGAGAVYRSERKRSSAGPEMELCCETVGEQKLDEWRKTARRKARGELLVNLAAPGPLNSVAMEDEEQQSVVPSCWSGQRRLSVKFTRLTLLPPLENIFATVALYDVKTRQKLSENFHLDSSNLATAGKCGTSSGFITRALFKLPEEEGSDGGAGDGLMLVFRLEKALQQGGLDAALKAYTKKQSQKQDGQEDADQMPGQKPPKFRQQIGIVALPIARTVENAFNNQEAEQRQGNGGSGSARTFNDSFIRACPNQSNEKQQQNANDSLQAHSDKLSDCSSSAGLKFYGAEGNDCSALSSQSAKQPPVQSQLLRCHRWSRHLFGCPLSVQVSHFLKCEPLAESELFDWLQALLGTGGGQQSKQNNSRNSEKIPLDLRLELEMCQLEDVAREGWRIVSPECRLLNLTSGPQNVDGMHGDEQREEWMEQLEGSPLLAQDMLPFPVFPRLILPNSFARNLLFLYPRFVNFSARTGQTAARNICVHVELLDAQLRRLDAFVDGGSCLVGTVHTPITYHSKQPQFGGVEWKLLLPFDPPEGLHLRFKFVHVSCRPGETAAGAGKSAAAAMPAQTETPIGFSWLPLHPTADAPLPTGDQHMPISLDPLPPAICFLSPHLPFPHVHWLDGHRPLFQLSLQLVSSIQPQDTHLSNFLRLSSQWNAITATTDSSPPPNMVEELAQAVRNLLKIRPEPMLAFLHILLHRILAILQTSSVAESALSQCCFDILCQLAKITTVLLSGHVDKWGRSRILLDFVREQALPEVGQMVDLSNGNGMSEKRKKEKTMILTPISVGRGRVGSKKSREKLSNSNTEDNAKDISAAEGTAAIKHDVLPLHEHLARLFLGSQGTADMACSICWFPLSLIQRSMAEHLVRSGGQLLPPKARFSATFIACLDKLGKLVADELFDQLQKNFAQTQAINQAWAKFLRESVSLLLHSFVLRQFKRLCRLMDAHIETLQAENPALADKVLSLKLAFIRTLYSHEHFLFLCLPFAELPTTNPPPTASAVETQSSLLAADGLLKRSLANLATAARRMQYTSSGSIASSLGSRTHHKMSTSKSQSASSSALFGHPSEEHAHQHFPVSLLLSQLHSLIITNSPSMPACVDLLHWLIAGHESDWRLKDPELRHQLALIYSPLLAIVLAIVLELMSGSREGGEQLLLFSSAAGETTASGTSAADPDQCSAAEEVRSNKSAGGTAGGGKRRQRWTRARKKLLLCLCWLLRSLHQPTLLQHLRQFSPIRVTQFVLLLRSLVSMFAQPLPVPPSQQQRRNSTDSFVQIGPVQADEFHLLLPSIESICAPPAAAPPTPTTSNKITTPLLGWYRSVENKLSDRDLGGRQAAAMEERSNSSSHKGILLSTAEDEEATAQQAATVHVRWRKDGGGDEAEDNTPTERVISRQLSTEVLLLVLDQFELLLQLAPSSMPSSPLLPELMGLLLHILSGHNSLAAQQHIFRTQRAFVRKFPNFLFDGQNNNTTVLEQQQQSQFLSGLCLQLLRHMSSELAETRADAALSAFTLLRISQRLHKGAFIRLNKAFTMSLSSLVSNAAASGLTLNDAALRQSLEAILQFRDGTAETKSSKESAAAATWRSQLEELVANLSAILSDTLKLGACGDDFEMAVDLMERIAHGYRTNPELRIAWLMAIARKHLKEERRNYAEAAQCLLHCCAIMADQLAAASSGGGVVDDDAELLPQQPVFQAFEELMGDNVREEWPQGRAAAVRGVARAAEQQQQQQEQPMFSVNTFAEMVEKMAKLFERAQLFELMPTLFKLVLPMHERRHAHAKQIQLYAQIAACLGRVEPPPQLLALGDDWPATGTGNCLADKRCFGTYFRVRFFGARFGGDLDGQDFVYKEPAVTKLAEISHRFEDLYAAKFGPNALHMIKDSNEVNQKSLDPSQAYIQIIYVEPHFERREQKRRRTHLQRSYRLKQFLYATPFTQQGGKAHGSLGEQFKRKTVLTVENSFPYVKTRLRVIRQESSVLTPIEVAIEDVQKRSRELAWAVGARPVDAKILQMHLQGCIGATVNQGPLEIARVFLTGASLDASGLPRDAVQRRLRLCFDELGRRCAEALEINERLLGSDREDYQKELRRNMVHFEQSLTMLGRRPSTPPSSSSSSSAVLDPGVTR